MGRPAERDDLENRDPDYVREMLPMFWMIASFWFRPDVRGPTASLRRS